MNTQDKLLNHHEFLNAKADLINFFEKTYLKYFEENEIETLFNVHKYSIEKYEVFNAFWKRLVSIKDVKFGKYYIHNDLNNNHFEFTYLKSIFLDDIGDEYALFFIDKPSVADNTSSFQFVFNKEGDSDYQANEYNVSFGEDAVDIEENYKYKMNTTFLDDVWEHLGEIMVEKINSFEGVIRNTTLEILSSSFPDLKIKNHDFFREGGYYFDVLNSQNNSEITLNILSGDFEI